MPKKLTQEEVILRFHEVHGDLYDYSKVEYKGMHTKVLIIDKKYGEFWQKPDKHVSGQGHPKRGGKMKLTQEEVILRFHEVHGDLYDYSKVEYKGIHTKVLIIDKKYGEFWQTPSNHMSGNGHPERVYQHQKLGYISGIFDNGTIVGLKYGVESIEGLRCIQQNKKSIYDIKRLITFVFDTSNICRVSEAECKSIFQKENKKSHGTLGIVRKSELPDGYTETTHVKNLDKIIEIYIKWGGIEVTQ